MVTLQQEVEPADVSIDPTRLARIGRFFDRYVENGSLPGYLLVVARGGRVAELRTQGIRDRAANLPIDTDTLWRVYSMTKPVTSAAALVLYEEGVLSLTDPVSNYLPAFADSRVYSTGMGPITTTTPAADPVRLWHLLTHTSGLTYGSFSAHPVSAAYLHAGLAEGYPRGLDLAQVCDLYSRLPLQFQPGTAWNYGVNTDLLARVIEVASGVPFEDFIAERVFTPLAMDDARFHVGSDRAHRLAALHQIGPDGVAVPTQTQPSIHPQDCVSAGGGLVVTAGDYYRFIEMLRNGGSIDGNRVLAPRTVKMMTTNQLPGNTDLRTFSPPELKPDVHGYGFGFGVQVTIDPVAARTPSQAGEFGWMGKGSTYFFVDPKEDLSVLFLSQLQPQSALPILASLKQLVYQALVG